MEKKIAIIYEGEKTERNLFDNLNKIFFSKDTELVPVLFPAGENIYMIWKQLRADDFQTDIIEVVREYNKTAQEALKGYSRKDFMETYLFFDYDGHNDNLGQGADTHDVLDDMLDTFSDETDLGKLYINYPMVESIRDNLKEERCYRRCKVKLSDIGNYKHIVHEVKDFQDSRKYDRESWKIFCKNAVCRGNCLVNGRYERPKREVYFHTVNQSKLFHAQRRIIEAEDRITVLNSVPLFLLEYFKVEFWNEMLNEVGEQFS
ncbi:MAG: hypothetical protein NC489_32310 [Ruminococcus flavefaciens]|nr:hypothetical protein [Ruminococcus flavefaciens]